MAVNYYQLLQVDSAASTTVIRYAYRYMAAMYHPDNAETADTEKFKLVTEAWRVLSDPNKRNAYDLQLGAGLPGKSSMTLQSAMGRAAGTTAGASARLRPDLPPPGASSTAVTATVVTSAAAAATAVQPKTSTAWSEVDLRLAILQVLMDAKRKKPQTGGATAKMLMDCTGVGISELEYILWYLREKNYIKREEAQFTITIAGVDYLVDQLSKTEILNPK